MEKVLHPDCSCGQPVAYDFEMIPVFEDGIQIAQEQGNVYFMPYCEPCMYEAYVACQEYLDQRDELPF